MEPYLCCNPEESKYFGERFRPALAAMKTAHECCSELINAARAKSRDEGDVILWMLAASCMSEFDDIVLLSGNGRGSGAMKVLRALYERTVTLSYLVKKPDKIAQFIEYSNVHWHKLLLEATRVHADFKIDPEEAGKIREHFERTQDKYQREACKKCKTTELQPSWTKLPIPDMASQVNDVLRGLAFNAYLRPTFYIHTTHFGTLDQIDKGGEGKLRFDSVERQRDLAATAVQLAHCLMLQVIEVVNGHFSLGRNDLAERVAKELDQSWGGPQNA